jgi:hypothetical protein
MRVGSGNGVIQLYLDLGTRSKRSGASRVLEPPHCTESGHVCTCDVPTHFGLAPAHMGDRCRNWLYVLTESTSHGQLASRLPLHVSTTIAKNQPE